MQDIIHQPLSSGSANLTRWARLGAALPGLASIGFGIQMLAHLLFLVFSTLLGDKPELAPDDGDLTARLWVRTRAGQRLLLARGVESDEVDSLRALHEALRGRPAFMHGQLRLAFG